MPQPKTVSYPNLVDQISKVVAAHEAVQESIRTHVQDHHAALENKRKQLHVAHMAKKLIEEDGKS